MKKTYLGDGVYVKLDDFGSLILTTEDGVQVTNTIVIEYDVWVALSEYVSPLVAQAVMGLSIMPDKYRRLVDIKGNVCQIGCSAIEWEDLFAELDRLDIPDWEKDNVIDYKISIMLSDPILGIRGSRRRHKKP